MEEKPTCPDINSDMSEHTNDNQQTFEEFIEEIKKHGRIFDVVK